MITPDKIYLHGYEFSERPVNSWSEKQTDGIKGHKAINVEYIRKDKVIEILVTAQHLAAAAYKIDKL